MRFRKPCPVASRRAVVDSHSRRRLLMHARYLLRMIRRKCVPEARSYQSRTVRVNRTALVCTALRFVEPRSKRFAGYHTAAACLYRTPALSVRRIWSKIRPPRERRNGEAARLDSRGAKRSLRTADMSVNPPLGKRTLTLSLLSRSLPIPLSISVSGRSVNVSDIFATASYRRHWFSLYTFYTLALRNMSTLRND
jgi:hypothetical protein